MTSFLVFRLFGPMAAWGDVAVGQKRGVTRTPSRSAMLGLLGAALGLDRFDPKLKELHSAYGVASRTEGDGALLVDYHTTQTVDAGRVKKQPARTRRDEILRGGRDLNTILSSREYWTDLLYTVAVWARPEAPWGLDTLQSALLNPVFPLYLGRRSCPPGLPLRPALLEGENPVDVLRRAELDPLEQAVLRGLRLPDRFEIAWEDFAVDVPHHVHSRRDQPGSRKTWQFSSRLEYRAVFQRGDHVSQ